MHDVVKIETEVAHKSSEKTSKVIRYYITSSQKESKEINDMVRKHWSVENNLHWMLDVFFNEDMSRRRIGNSTVNFNIISKISLALIEKVPLNKSKRQRLFKAGFDTKFREKVLNL